MIQILEEFYICGFNTAYLFLIVLWKGSMKCPQGFMGLIRHQGLLLYANLYGIELLIFCVLKNIYCEL